MLGIPDEEKRKNPKKKRKSVVFNEEEEIINPEDIDPSIGRFRNLVQTTIIPSSKVWRQNIFYQSKYPNMLVLEVNYILNVLIYLSRDPN